MLQARWTRLALVFVMLFNLVGMASCIMLVAVASGRDFGAAAHLAQALRHALRLFMAGAFIAVIPGTICWVEIDILLPQSRLPFWSINILVLASGILFLLAGWQLPHAIIRGLQGG